MVLCHFTQTTERDTTYTLLPCATGAPFAAEMQQFKPHTFTWTVWDSYTNFVDTTFKSLHQRHFRTIPSLRYAKLPDKHYLFNGTWDLSTHPAHQDVMTEITVRVWTPDLRAIIAAFNRRILPQLDQQQQETWFENVVMNGDEEGVAGME